MYKFIGIEDLAANALIELIETNGCRRVSFATLVEYGNVVVEVLNRDGKQDAVAIFSRNRTNDLLRNYSDFFEIDSSDPTGDAIVLKPEKTADDLRAYFRAFLTVDWLVAFRDQTALQVLGVAA